MAAPDPSEVPLAIFQTDSCAMLGNAVDSVYSESFKPVGRAGGVICDVPDQLGRPNTGRLSKFIVNLG